MNVIEYIYLRLLDFPRAHPFIEWFIRDNLTTAYKLITCLQVTFYKPRYFLENSILPNLNTEGLNLLHYKISWRNDSFFISRSSLIFIGCCICVVAVYVGRLCVLELLHNNICDTSGTIGILYFQQFPNVTVSILSINNCTITFHTRFHLMLLI